MKPLPADFELPYYFPFYLPAFIQDLGWWLHYSPTSHPVSQKAPNPTICDMTVRPA